MTRTVTVKVVWRERTPASWSRLSVVQVSLRTLLGALCATALLAACSSSSHGPLGRGGYASIECMRGPLGHPVTAGIFNLTNAGTSAVTITGVTLPGSHGLAMTKQLWLVPIRWDAKHDVHTNVGSGGPYPPPLSESPQWVLRRPAIGGIIKAHHTLNLVFGLTRTTAKAGKAPVPVIAYTADGTSYTVKEQTALIVAADCTTEP